MQAQSNSARNPTAKPDLDRVRSFVEPVLVAHGVDLVDVEWTGGPGGLILRVTVERVGEERLGAGADASGAADAGISLDDCADISRDLSAVLDVEDVIPQRYVLEVSSPGLERTLRHRQDFERFAGKLARVKLARPAADGQRVLRGTIEKVDGDAIGADACAMRVDGKRIEFSYADVREANLVFELSTTPKRGAPKPGSNRGSGGKKAAKGSGLA